uniref:Alpha 2-HS glycoprotein n=1 Tax=Salvator merianae TaxID=96440 RepID=A0A8D0EG34_SALMN
MKSLLSLVLLGLIVACSAVSPPLLAPPRILACDDPETEHAAAVSVNHINDHNLHGYKQVVNRIEKVNVLPRRPHGEIFFLELDLLETDCHVLSPVPAVNCTVRERTNHAVKAECDVKLLKDNGIFRVLAAKCHSSLDSAEDVAKPCLGCPLLSHLNDPEVVKAAHTGLNTFNAKNNTGYTILEISRGIKRVYPITVHVEFAIAATNCSAKDVQEHATDCHVLKGDEAQFGFCKATVIQNLPGAVEGAPLEEISVSCTIFEHEPRKAHAHLAEHHFGKKIPSPGVGHTILDLAHSHNDTHASHESHSAEAGVPVGVVKRSVVLGPGPQICPGRIRHFALD